MSGNDPYLSQVSGLTLAIVFVVAIHAVLFAVTGGVRGGDWVDPVANQAELELAEFEAPSNK